MGRPDVCPGFEDDAQGMSLTATSHSVSGTLRQEVVIDGRHRLVTDEPARLGGDGTGPAPHELLPAAIASCVATSLVMYARTREFDLGEVSVDVAFDNRSTPRRCNIAVRLGSRVDATLLERLERVAQACPVRRSLEAGVEFTESITCGNHPAVGAGRGDAGQTTQEVIR